MIDISPPNPQTTPGKSLVDGVNYVAFRNSKHGTGVSRGIYFGTPGQEADFSLDRIADGPLRLNSELTKHRPNGIFLTGRREDDGQNRGKQEARGQRLRVLWRRFLLNLAGFAESWRKLSTSCSGAGREREKAGRSRLGRKLEMRNIVSFREPGYFLRGAFEQRFLG